MKKGFVMAAIFSSLLGLFGCDKTPPSDYKVADVYRDLRQQVLTTTPAKIGVSPASPDQVWAVMMETGYPEAVMTLVAIADGTISLYFSNGGGIIGLGQHDGPRKAGVELLSSSQSFLKEAGLTKNFPLPGVGKTRFYFVTLQGVHTVEFKEDDLGKNKVVLSPLFYKAQEVITQARIADEKRKAEQGSPANRP
jgi:hypothetical protein